MRIDSDSALLHAFDVYWDYRKLPLTVQVVDIGPHLLQSQFSSASASVDSQSLISTQHSQVNCLPLAMILPDDIPVPNPVDDHNAKDVHILVTNPVDDHNAEAVHTPECVSNPDVPADIEVDNPDVAANSDVAANLDGDSNPEVDANPEGDDNNEDDTNTDDDWGESSEMSM